MTLSLRPRETPLQHCTYEVRPVRTDTSNCFQFVTNTSSSLLGTQVLSITHACTAIVGETGNSIISYCRKEETQGMHTSRFHAGWWWISGDTPSRSGAAMIVVQGFSPCHACGNCAIRKWMPGSLALSTVQAGILRTLGAPSQHLSFCSTKRKT